ncbi:putative hydrolase [Microterricola viridarii]|uniref:Putative hydrolase n=2 Tax=Microterricola viridarii TaxID=412690 RepID=A0A1H1RVM3_9MICO|nr:putative hydrolase [Microterricola viridarii]
MADNAQPGDNLGPDDNTPDDDLQRMLRDILSGNFPDGGASFDPAQLAGAAGLPNDPASIAALMNQLRGAMSSAGDGINWDLALRRAEEKAAAGQEQVTPEQRAQFDQAFNIAALWLDEVIAISEITVVPSLITRRQWVAQSMPLWTQLAEPVATSIADTLTGALGDQLPEEMRGMLAQAMPMMRSLSGTLFAMQLGEVVGELATEVISGGDIGIPLLAEQHAALLPQNVMAFSEGLDVGPDQVQIYLAVRELAHARLFRHARWLRLHLISAIRSFAQGISVDAGKLEELASGFDPSNPEELRQAMVDGSLIPPKSEAQLAALAQLETMLALIEGWVNVVTAEATGRLPGSVSIAEMVRRRRAAGGPAESAFATLVGLELRPRRQREAAAMWQAVTDAVGNDARDALWAHPDILPTSADLDDPASLVARLVAKASGVEPELDEIDQALEALLRGDGPERPLDPNDPPA